MSHRSNALRRALTVVLLGGGLALPERVIAQPIVDPDVKVNDSRGRDGADTSDICCWDPDPDALPCVGAEWDKCCFNREKACLGGTNHTGDCTDDDDCPDGGVCVPCDDEPKKQREMWIAAATWDPTILLATWIDSSKVHALPGNTGEQVLGLAISDDSGSTWKRLKHTLDPCDPACDPAVDCFEIGSSLTLDDICYGWFTQTQGDPAVAATGDPNDPGQARYFYFVGLDGGSADFFSRLEWTDPLSGWETAPLPGGGGHVCKVAADPLSGDVYVTWQGVFLTASRTAGDDFFNCQPTCAPPVAGRRIGYKPSVGSFFPPAYAAGAVGPDGDFNVVWWLIHGQGINPPTEIRYRRGTWSGNTLDFAPELPDESATDCIEGFNCAESIVHGHAGYTVGYGAPFVGTLVYESTRMKAVSWPSIAVDRNSLSDLCGRGGTIYVTYAAQEFPGGTSSSPFSCDTTRAVDSNVYVVRGRVVNGTMVDWSAPVNVLENITDPTPVLCDEPYGPGFDGEVPCGLHLPLQFFPAIAVDEQGRVGVMFFDTTIDGNRCNRNVVYQIKFTYSLDGGVTWETPATVSQFDSETSPDESFFEVSFVDLGEYYAMTGASEAGDGVFHPIWADLRGWEGKALEVQQVTGGDAYTALVTLTAANDPVVAVGDYNRDGTNDQSDLDVLVGTCMCSTDVACEIFDFDRDGLITTADEYHFHQCPHGVLNDPPPSCTGDPANCRSCVTCPDTPACADTDEDGKRDDVCVWWDCCGTCCETPTDPNPADMGGPFGDCPPDGFCNIHDMNHVLTCFAGTNGCDTINIDAGGAFGACPPDGFCNIHDYNHAGNCFAGKNPCDCGQSAMASGPPEVVGATALRVIRAPQLGASDTVTLRVFTQSALADLQSYQLELSVSGGTAGQFELLDISIEPRADYVFAEHEDNFTAFNVATGQMLSGVDIDPGVQTSAHGYLATYTYAVSPDAAGDFVADVHYDESSGDQTFLIASNTKKIDIAGSTPAVIVTSP